MAVTESQHNGDGIARIATGRRVDSGTAAAFDITCGFRPRYVRVQNVTSGDGMEWFYGMSDANAVKQVAAGDKTIITSLGITPLVDEWIAIG
mgnify:FL=1